MSAHYKQWHSLPKCEVGDFYKHPRTIVEAYPSDLSHDICTIYEPMQRSEKAFCWILVAIAAVVVALFKTGVIK